MPGYEADLSLAERKMADKEWAEAVPLWGRVVRANPMNGAFWAELARARRNAGDHRGAIAASETALTLRAGIPSTTAYRIASSYALLGERRQALEWLERAFAMGFRHVEEARLDPDLATLHEEPRFRDLVGAVDRAALSREEGWRRDLAFLSREVFRRSWDPFLPETGNDPKSAGKMTREEFERRIRAIGESVANLTDYQVEVELARLLQRLGDGHTAVWGSDESLEHRQTLPLLFSLFEEGLYVIAAEPDHRDLLGAQVLRFGDRSVDELVDGVAPLISRDNDMWIKQVAPYRFRHLPLLHALGLIPSPREVHLSVRDAEGTTRSVLVAGDDRWPEIWNTLPCPSEWVRFEDTGSVPVPLYLRDMARPYWFEHLADINTVYFQYNRVIDDGNEPLATFSERLFRFIEEHEVQRLIIDMRWNNGGDTFLNEPLLRRLVACERVNAPGKLFVIIGRRTFSAAMNAACYLERLTHATFVGEPTGGKPNSAGDETPFRLPYSGTWLNLSDVYWQSSWPYDHRTSIAPRIYAPPTFAAYSVGRDPALEVIFA